MDVDLDFARFRGVVSWTIQQRDTKGYHRSRLHTTTVSQLLSWLDAPEEAGTLHAKDDQWTIELVLLNVQQINPTEKLAVRRYFDRIFPIGIKLEGDANTVEFDSVCRYSKTNQCSRSYIISNKRSGIHWEWCPEARKTRGCIWYHAFEYRQQVIEVLKGIETFREEASHPLLLGVLELRYLSETLRTFLDIQIIDFEKAQIDTGYHRQDLLLSSAPTRHLDRSDLEHLAKETCGLATNTTTCSLCLVQTVRLSLFLQAENRLLKKAKARCKQAHSPQTLSVPSDVRLLHCETEAQLESWSRCAQSLSDLAESWKHKGDIIVQTLFTLTNQRDQSISIQIAEDSRTLAEKATRESTSMNAIAAVTMCFLPGTFVSSLFAVPMFDWAAPLHNTINHHFWIYWAVTLPLTFIVVAVWFWWSHYMNRNMPLHRFDEDRNGESEKS